MAATARKTNISTHTDPRPLPSALLTTREAGAYLGVSFKTLEHWRLIGFGPAYAKFGNHVRYSSDDLCAFLAANTIIPAPAGSGR